MNTDRKTVLFVDDCTQFLELIQMMAEELKRDEWNVLIASTTAQALRLMEAHEVHLAVLDLRMPIVDGVQFLQLIHRKYPQMRKALLSSYADDARRQNAMQHGAELILSKPLAQDGFDVLFETLNELLHRQMEEGFRGVLRKIGLDDILQMECLSRHTSLIEIVAAGQRGRIYIKSGRLVHAEFGGATGETALNQLLALRSGDFLHAPYAEPPAQTLEGQWEFLLMEAARHRDEAMAASGEIVGEGQPEVPAASAVNEIVVASARGDVLFERGSPHPQSRAAIVRVLHAVARRLDELSFGNLERVEFETQGGRIVTRLDEQGGVLVRGNTVVK